MGEKITLCCATQNHLSKVKFLLSRTLAHVDEAVFVDGFT